jgi:NDP-sugar pyrophosphorylase family protein
MTQLGTLEKNMMVGAPTTTVGREAVILAGGKGVRLRPYTTLIPKPLVPIGEQHSILEIVLRQLADQGFTKASIAIGHLGQLIRAYVGDGSQWGIEVQYLHEETPLGTIGPVLSTLENRSEHFVIMNGDVLTNIDFDDLLERHIELGAPMTVATYDRQHRIDFGVLDVAGERVTCFREKPMHTYTVSMGVYAVAKKTLRRYCAGQPLGFDDLMIDLLRRGERPASYRFAGYWLDIGRPDDYDQANREFPALKSMLLPGD